MFNITSRALNDVTTLHLVDPETQNLMYADEKETKPLTIELYGRSSKVYRNWLEVAQRKQNKAGPKAKDKDVETQMQENADFLATMSVKASNFDMGAGPIDTKEAFKKLYADSSLLWIVEQVSAQLNDLAAFMPK